LIAQIYFEEQQYQVFGKHQVDYYFTLKTNIVKEIWTLTDGDIHVIDIHVTFN